MARIRGLRIEMIRTPRLVDQQTLQLRASRCSGRQRTQVDLSDLQSPAVVDERHRLVVDRSNAGAKIFATGDNDVQGLFQHLEFQFAREPHRLGLVVYGLSANHLLHEPDSSAGWD